MSEPGGERSAMGGPVFVVGQGRSGTTLLAAMLNAHPSLACGPETSFFDLVAGKRRQLVEDPHWPAKAIDFVVSMRRAGKHSVLDDYGLTSDQVSAVLRSRTPALGAILESLTVPYAQARGKQRWCEKTPRHLLWVSRIRHEWPDAAIVHIVRDPRAVAASYLKVPFGPSSAVAAAYLWREGDERSARMFERDRAHLRIRYEDLVRDPRPEAQRLAEFLGETFDERMLRPNETDVRSLTAGSQWKARVAEPIDATRIDAWRTELSDADQARVATICADGMQRLGYDAATAASAPSRAVWLRPLDPAFLRDAPDFIEQATDHGLVFRQASRTWRHGDGRLILWGATRSLRWASGGRGGSVRALAGWAQALGVARLRGRAVLWVDRRTTRRRRGGLIERCGDGLARVLAARVTPEDALRVVTEEAEPSTR